MLLKEGMKAVTNRDLIEQIQDSTKVFQDEQHFAVKSFIFFSAFKGETDF